jgi:hypothetical protein
MLLRWCFGSCSLSISCTLNNVFSPGLQVWSTASGKEQDQDKDTFPRSDSFNFVSMLLLGLVNWSDSTLLPCTADCWSLLIVLVQNFSHQNKYAR